VVENDKVLVDTSVWIDFLRGDQGVVSVLGALIRSGRVVVSGQILQEVLQGSRDEKAFRKLEAGMSVWEAGSEEQADFIEAARIFARLRWTGITIPPTDCLVAAFAIRRQLWLYALDGDFDHLRNLKRYDPAASF
jgi:predicted nucleic acid-binding protein